MLLLTPLHPKVKVPGWWVLVLRSIPGSILLGAAMHLAEGSGLMSCSRCRFLVSLPLAHKCLLVMGRCERGREGLGAFQACCCDRCAGGRAISSIGEGLLGPVEHQTPSKTLPCALSHSLHVSHALLIHWPA